LKGPHVNNYLKMSSSRNSVSICNKSNDS